MGVTSRRYRAVRCLARRLRYAADRIDPAGAPRRTHWSFTFEPGVGAVFHEDGRGCPVWYLGTQDYQRAHEEGWLSPRADAAHTSRDGMTEAETAEALRVLAGFPRPDERRVLSTGRDFQYDAGRRIWREAG